MQRKNIVVLLSALLGVMVFLYRFCLLHGMAVEALSWGIAVGLLVPLADIDRREGIIPNRILVVGAIAAAGICLLGLCLEGSDYIRDVCASVAGLLLGGGIFLIGGMLSKGGVGSGDVKLFAVLGLLVRFRGVFGVLLLTVLMTGITGVIFLLFQKKKWKDTLPLAPFALLAALIAAAAGI